MVNMILVTFALLSILKSAVLRDRQFNIGATVARRLHINALVSDFFGGVYATRLAAHLYIPIRENDILVPPSFLDYEAMQCHQFLERNHPPFWYRLIFNKHRVFHITLPAPAFFNVQEKQRHYKL
jgi:hypothetical protein